MTENNNGCTVPKYDTATTTKSIIDTLNIPESAKFNNLFIKGGC